MGCKKRGKKKLRRMKITGDTDRAKDGDTDRAKDAAGDKERSKHNTEGQESSIISYTGKKKKPGQKK